MNQRTVFFVSDQTGITAETLGRSLLTQFESVKFRQVTLPFINTVDKAREAVRKINLTAQVEGRRPVVFSTLVQEDLLAILKESEGLYLDFIDTFLSPLEREFGIKSTHTSGRAHGAADSPMYAARIEAIHFTLASDDGLNTQNYDNADVILVGISRTGKTPTCLYLALQYGIYAANYPLIEEELESGNLPGPVQGYPDKLYGLTIDPERLRQIRHERRPDSKYSSIQQVTYELREAEKLFKKHGLVFTNTTHSSIEEIASHVLSEQSIERRVH